MLNLKDDSWMMSPFPKDQLTVIFENAYFVKKCRGCDGSFTSIIRKHHCRGCGKVFCGQCTRKNLLSEDQVKLRLCAPCEVKKNKQMLGCSVGNDKENLSPYGNATKLSFELESDTPIKNTVYTNPSIYENIPLASPLTPHITIRTPKKVQTFDVSAICTPPQEPETIPPIKNEVNPENKSKNDKRICLNACCIFLVLFCMCWFTSHYTTKQIESNHPIDILSNDSNNLLYDSSLLNSKNMFQSMIDLQVELTEEKLVPLIKASQRSKSNDKTALVPINQAAVVVEKNNKENKYGFKHQLAKWSGIRTLFKKIWIKVTSIFGKITSWIGRKKVKA